MFAEPLPNDLLRNPPWPQTIATWPVNDAFLSIIDKSENILRHAGYALKYGVEVNLGIVTSAEAQKIIKRQRKTILSAWRLSCRELFWKDAAAINTPVQFPKAAQEAFATLEQIAARHLKNPTEEGRAWLVNWELAQSFYRQAMEVPETKKTGQAQRDFMVATLHLLPPHMGGLHGIIEQRFKSEHYGHGWWDGKDMLELRTLPIEGHETAIGRVHQSLWQLKRACEKFGFVPLVDVGQAQVGFSLWRLSDNRNMMERTDDEEVLSLRKKLGQLLYNRLRNLPIARLFGSGLVTTGPFIGSSRVSTIRTHEKHWEFRAPHISGIAHVARDMSFIASAASDIFLDEKALPENVKKRRNKLLGLMMLLDDIMYGKFIHPEIRTVKRLAIEADPPRTACPFISCLKGGILGENNELLVPRDVIEWNGSELAKAIGGERGLDLYTVKVEGEIYNLGIVNAWQELFKKLRWDENGVIDASMLHPLLARHFQGLRVSSIHTDIHMPEQVKEVGVESYRFTDPAVIRMLAKGEFAFGAGLPEQQEVFRFIGQRAAGLDREDALNFLIGIYERTKDVGPRNAESGAHAFMMQVIGQHLAYAMPYYSANFGELTPCHLPRDILGFMMSYRAETLAAVAEAKTYDGKRSKEYFNMLGPYLSDPRKIYGFPVVKKFFMEVAMEMAFHKGLIEHVDTSSEMNFRSGREMGKHVVLLAAAAQTDDPSTLDILREYQASVEGLSKLPQMPSPMPAADDLPAIHRLMTTYLRGVEEGIREETANLLRDHTSLASLRQEAKSGLRL